MIGVMGATGTIGSEVLRALRTRGADAVALVRDPIRVDGPARRLDLTDACTHATALAGCGSLFFMTPLIEDQVPLSRALLDAALDAGVGVIVRLSSRAAGWDRECPLRGWHREIDDMVRDSGVTFTILRPCSFFQNLLGPSLSLARSRGLLALPMEQGAIPFLDAVDIGEAAARLLVDPGPWTGQTLVLTGGVALTGDDLAAGLADALGQPVRYRSSDPERVRQVSGGSMPEWLLESGLRVYAHAAAGLEAPTDPALGEVLGRPPRDYAAFLRANISVAGGATP